MITIESQITGNEIGRKLADDPEELAYALQELASSLSESDIEEILTHIYSTEALAEIAKMCRTMTAAVEKEEGA